MTEGDPTLELHGLLARAAQMRAAGETWKQVATAVGRSVNTVMQWPSRHPQEWNRILLKAIDESLGEYENEALLTARIMLQSEDERAKADAMRALLRHTRELRGTKMRLEHTGLAGGRMELLLKLSNEEIDAIANAKPDTRGEGGKGVAPDAE